MIQWEYLKWQATFDGHKFFNQKNQLQYFETKNQESPKCVPNTSISVTIITIQYQTRLHFYGIKKQGVKTTYIQISVIADCATTIKFQ